MHWFNKRSGVENGGIGCGWGLVHVIKHHRWPHFFKRLSHHHKTKRLLGSRTTNDFPEEESKSIIVQETPGSAPRRKTSSIKARMRSLLADEMLRLRTSRSSSHHHPSESLNSIQPDLKPSHPAQKPKEYLDALGIISVNEDFLVKVLQDPGSPLAHHFQNQQALSAKRALVKSETFPIPSSHTKWPTRLKPKNDQTQEEEDEEAEEDQDSHRGTRIVMKRLKDFKQKIIKHAIKERKKEMPKVVALDAFNHKVAIDNNSNNNNNNLITGKKNKLTKPKQMRRASSLNDDRYSQLYDNSLDQGVASEGVRRTRVAPKHLARIYSLPDMKWHNDTSEKEEVFEALGYLRRRSFKEETAEEAPIAEEEEDDEYQGDGVSPEEDEDEDEDEEEASFVKAEEKAEFRYVKDIVESYEEAKGCVVMEPDCCGRKCDHPLLFDLINQVLMEIYANSYTYYPFPLSHPSRTSPMPVGRHVLKQVWALVSSYLNFRPTHPDAHHSLDFVVARDVAKSGWWMDLQFDCECVALELEDLIFHDLLDQLLSDVTP